MVSPQHQKVDDVGTSPIGSWGARPVRSPIIPSVMGNFKDDTKDYILNSMKDVANFDKRHVNLEKVVLKNPNKRTHDQIELEEFNDHNNNKDNFTKTISDSEVSPSYLREDGLRILKSDVWHENPVEDYKMSAKERGFCLIINNVAFENNIFPPRKGSDMDAYRLRKIFKSFGFEVDCKRNMSSEKMQNAFKQKAALCMPKHDALVVILLSHGSEHGVYGVDGIEVNLNDVLSYFDNKNCKTMRGKPKVFIVQACRGRMVDYGVLNTTQTFFSQPESQSCLSQPSQLTQISSQVIRLPHWGELDKDHNPVRTDMVLCFSTQTGYVSNRNEEEGSWLGCSLSARLCEEAHRRHLMDIFNMVSRDIRTFRSSNGLKQVLEITSIGFDKNLYFNPGLFK